MKRLLFGVLFLTFFLFPLPRVFADHDDELVATTSVADETESATDSSTLAKNSVKEEIQYTLPYPGVLPDNPLYSLKTFRDKVISFLINDPLKKAEFNLLNADKRINAGILLAQKKKADLALTTVSKGNNYFHQAISSVESAKKNGQDVKPILERMHEALKKYTDVFEQMEQEDSNLEKNILQEKKRVTEFQKKVDTLLKAK